MNMLKIGLFIYLAGFVFCVSMNATMSPNATPALMLVRSIVWFIYMPTGWPHGVPMTIDNDDTD